MTSDAWTCEQIYNIKNPFIVYVIFNHLFLYMNWIKQKSVLIALFSYNVGVSNEIGCISCLSCNLQYTQYMCPNEVVDYLPLIQSIMSWEPCCTKHPQGVDIYLSGLKIKSQTTLNIHVHVIISKNLWQISINCCTHDPQRSKWHLLIRDPKLWVKLFWTWKNLVGSFS